MQAFDPVLIRGRTVWDREVLPERLLADRRRRVDEGMTARGLDVLVVYGDVRRHGSLTWLCNYLPRVRDAVLLVPRDGEDRLFVNVSSRDVPAAASISSVAQVTSFDRLQPEATDWIAARPPSAWRWGLVDVAGGMPAALWERLFPGRAPSGLADASGWFEEMRFAKAPEEAAAVSRAARLAGEALAEGLASAEGTREVDLAAAVERAGRRRGAEDVRVLIGSGGGLGRGGDRVVPPAAPLAVHVVLKWNRYWAEVGRTLRRDSDGAWRPAPGAASRRVDEVLRALRAAGASATVSDLASLAAEGTRAGGPPAVEAIGIDASESLPADGTAAVPVGTTLAVRWADPGAPEPDLWGETLVWETAGPRCLTAN